MVGAGRGGGPVKLPTPLPGLMPPAPGIRQGDWNLLSITMDANVIRPILNQSYDFIPGATDERDDYGPIALYVGGAGEVRFKDVSFKDLHLRKNPPEQSSSRFRIQRIDEFYQSWGATAGDFNNDGVLDVVAGPYYYLGPNFATRGEIDISPAQAPSTSFARTMVDYAYDFTGDGWTDVLAGESRPMHLYVNPKGEHRRWAKHAVLPQITSEIALMRDIDGDGKPEIVFGTGGVGGTLAFGWPDPANPDGTVADTHHFGARARARPWPRRWRCQWRRTNRCSSGGGMVGTAGCRAAHRSLDIPSARFRALGARRRRGRRRDGRVRRERRPSERRRRRLECAWIRARVVRAEARRGRKHHVRSTHDHRRLFDQKYGRRHHLGDAWGDDGRRGWRQDSRFRDRQAAVLASGELGRSGPVRRRSALLVSHGSQYAKAPGGAEFVPELIHNKSGVGSHVTATDLNKDGNVDIVTSTNRGTFIFWGQRRR